MVILILENMLSMILLLFSIIAFLIILIIYCYHLRLNFASKNKYKREKIENDSNFKVKRCKEEYYSGNSDRIYIIDKKRKTYHCIIDPYTLNQLGFGFQDAPLPKENEKEKEKYFFSKKDYNIGERIKIYNLTADIGQVIVLVQKFKKELFK